MTSETPTEHVSTVAPTTPLPMPRAVAKKSRAGLIVGALVVAVLGVGGYLVLGRGKTPQVATPVTPPPQTGGTDSAKAPPRRQTPPPRRTVATPPVAAAEEYGTITVNANPFGTVFIDGAEVGTTPIILYRVKAGRHTIRVERAGYKTQTETVQVDANNPVRRGYTLIPEG